MSEHSINSGKHVDRRIHLITAVLTLANFSICLHRSSRVYLFQQTQCLSYYLLTDPTKIGPNYFIDEMLCKNKDVQSPLSIIEGLDGFLGILPAILSLAVYNKLLPITGLRNLVIFNVFLAACTIILSIFFYSLHQSWSSIAIMSTFILDVIGGGDIARIVLCFTCISELAPPEKLTKSYNYVTALYLLGSVLATMIGSLLLSHHVYLLNILGVIGFAFTMLLTLLIPSSTGRAAGSLQPYSPSTPSIPLSSPTTSRSSSPDRDRKPSNNRAEVLETILTSYRSAFQALTTLLRVPHPTFGVLVLYLLNSFAGRVEVVLPQYISLTQHWTLATVNAALSLKALVSALVLLALPTIRTRYLEPRFSTLKIDFLISRVSLLASCIGMSGLGFPLPAPLFVTTLCVYTTGIGLPDSLASFGKLTLAEGSEPAAYFLRVGLVDSLSGLIGAPLWSAGFSFCLRTGKVGLGVPFWISGVLFAVGVVEMRRLERWTDYKAIPSA